MKEQRKKISTLTVTLSLSVSLSISISFGLELCWGLADNLLPLLGYVVYLTWMMIQLGLVHYWGWIQQPLLSLSWDGLFWQRIDIKGGREQSSALWASQNNLMMPIALLQKYLWWCPYMGSPAPTQESSSVVHLPHYKHSRHVCNLHMKWQISVKSHFIIKWLVSLAFLSN